MQHTPKTKICNITMHYYPIKGGQEVYIDELNKILTDHGLETSVLQRRTHTDRTSNTKIFFVPRIPKYVFFHPFISNAGWFAFNLGLYLSKKILRQQDIILCHYPFHYPPVRWHKKIVIISHGVLWSKIPATIFDRYHRWVSLRLKKENVFIVANDTNFLRELGYSIEPGKNYFTEVAKNVWFIPNCVDTRLFTSNPNKVKQKVILVPRNINYDRGIHLAIESFNIFAKTNSDFRMIIVGGGTGSYYNYCKNLVSKYNLNERITFAGHADRQRMLDYYHTSSVTLIPTIDKEGTSLSALESMACGTATVVTAVAGLLDLPAHKAAPDPVSIADALNYTIINKELLSTKQQDEVRRNFNIDLWKQSFLNVIDTIQSR